MSPGSPLDIQTQSSPHILNGNELLSVYQQARLNQYLSGLTNSVEKQNQIAKLEAILKGLIGDSGTDKELIQQEFNSSLRVCEESAGVGQVKAVVEQTAENNVDKKGGSRIPYSHR